MKRKIFTKKISEKDLNYVRKGERERCTIPMIGLPPLNMPFVVATVTSSSVFFNSADEMIYSNVAS